MPPRRSRQSRGGRSRRCSLTRRRRPPPAVPAPADEDPVRAAEYWLDDYGIENAWETTRGAGVRDRDHRHRRRARSGRVRRRRRRRHGRLGRRHRRRAHAGRRGRRQPRQLGRLARRGARHRPRHRHDRRRARGASCSRCRSASARPRRVPFTDQIAEAIRWSVDNGADVINLSLTTNTPDWDESWDDAFLYAFEHDVVVVVAAGNRGSGTTRVGAPATIPGVLTVAGVDPHGQGERRGVDAGHHDRRLGAERGARRRLGRRQARALERHERRRARSSRASPRSCGRRIPISTPTNVINRIIRTARPAAGGDRRCPIRCTATDWWMPRPPSRRACPPVDRQPDGQPRGVDPPVPPRRRATRCRSRTAEPVEVAAAAAAPTPRRARHPRCCRPRTPCSTAPCRSCSATATAILVALGVTAAVRRIRLASRAPSR